MVMIPFVLSSLYYLLSACQEVNFKANQKLIGIIFAVYNRPKSIHRKGLRQGGRAEIVVSPYVVRVYVNSISIQTNTPPPRPLSDLRMGYF